MNEVPIIIPSLEPDDRLLILLENLNNAGLDNIVIINDGSGREYDHYYDKAKKKWGCHIIYHKENKGKGRALKDGFQYCLKEYPDMIGCCTADSDGQHSTEDILKCIDALIQHKNSLILGVRDFSKCNVPWKSRWGNKITCMVFRYLVGLKITDTQTGLRAIPKHFMETLLDVSGERFEFETQMLIETKGKCDILEIKVATIYDSVENHSTHFHALKDSIKIYKIFGKIFVKYVMSSLSSCVVDIILFALISSYLEKNNVKIQYKIATATILARIFSAIYNYIINYKLVFRSKANHIKSGMYYAVLSVFQMLSSAFLTQLLSIILPISSVVIKIIVDTALFFVSYYIQHEFIFRNPKKNEDI